MKNKTNTHFPNFLYAFQPIVDVDAESIFSYEALIRGENKEPPNYIFSQVNPSELADFDQFARNIAIKTASELGIDCHLNLNFLPRCLQFSEQYIHETLEMATKCAFPIKHLIVEVTEEEAINDKQIFNECVTICRKLEIQVSLDDFGAGHSNLNLLVDFLPDQIKLDMHLMHNIDSHGPRQAIVKAVVQVCTALGIDIVAEGVETIEEYFWLRDQGIRLFQGFLFAKPEFKLPHNIYYPVKHLL